MFQNAYSTVRHSICLATNQSGRVDGQVFLLHDRLVVTAQHVVTAGMSFVGRWDGLWRTESVLSDQAQDIAVLVLKDKVTSMQFAADQAVKTFPQISEHFLSYGDDVAIVGYLNRHTEESGKAESNRIVTRGIVAFMETNPFRWGIHGAFAEPGFSGGPVFIADGQLVGVLTAVTSTKSLTKALVPMDFPMVSPLLQHRKQILGLIAGLGS